VPTTGAGIRCGLLVEGEVFIRPRRGGERLQINARRPRRSLRNLLQEAAIPPWERTRLPFLWCNDQLVWVGGLGINAAFACVPEEEGLLPVWELE
jgi:tRNA(Ile)-lysidine synthase